MNTNFEKLAEDELIQKTARALELNGMNVTVVNSGKEALEEALKLIPKGAEVLTATSMTTEAIGLTKIINDSGDYDAVKPKLAAMDRKTQHTEMQKLGAAPNYVVGSVHAINEDGHAFIASNSGSQLPSYAYGASNVIWIVSTKKIVKSHDDALSRIYRHVLPQESDRAKKAYGVPGSNVSKLLILNNENTSNRIRIILVKENLGF